MSQRLIYPLERRNKLLYIRTAVVDGVVLIAAYEKGESSMNLYSSYPSL
jgi:hypothetical protein